MARVVLAMSGGVDSSVAAHLLRQDGHEVIGVFMRHGEQAVAACSVEGGPRSTLPVLGNSPSDEKANHRQGCCSAADAHDARRVAYQLDFPFYALNFESEFGRIIDYGSLAERSQNLGVGVEVGISISQAGHVGDRTDIESLDLWPQWLTVVDDMVRSEFFDPGPRTFT